MRNTLKKLISTSLLILFIFQTLPIWELLEYPNDHETTFWISGYRPLDDAPPVELGKK